MTGFSTSFTLGKASVEHGANLAHNNRDFTAKNVDEKKISENITYVRNDVEDAYQEVFGEALREYNEKRTRKDRIISDYYKHISNSKREEAFYEIIVQFGDSKNAPCGSQNGEAAKKMLDEYIRNFKKRNPNLHIFNAVLHMDEASPHLHIDFIPFYTRGREKGLSKGVSMKAALDEQGFSAKNFKENRLVAWEANEREEMDRILQRNGFSHINKNAKYPHMSVEEYKYAFGNDEKNVAAALREISHVSEGDKTEEAVRGLKLRLLALENKTEALLQQKHSPYKPFFYSLPEKQAYVQSQLDALGIPYRETENGFEAQECFVEDIRKIEKEFKPVKSSAREKLREDIDRLLMQSKDIDELLEKLIKERYEIKQGKYLAVKPAHGQQFIRLKSLGEHYSEYALRNRISAKRKFEENITAKINAAQQKDSPDILVLRTIRFYTVAFSDGALPMKKRNKKMPFSWSNDIELDKLTALNKKINSGATLDTLRVEFEAFEQSTAQKEAVLVKATADLKSFYELKEKILMVFEGKKSEVFTLAEAELALKRYPSINKNNYRNIDTLIEKESENVRQATMSLDAEKEKLREAADTLAVSEKVMGGTYVQSLVGNERQRREAKFIPNGLKSAGI